MLCSFGCVLRAVTTTAFGAVFDLVPDRLPFFAPGERALARQADLLWEVRFFNATHH